MYHVEYMYMWFMSQGKLFMGVSSMWVGVVTHFSGKYLETYKYTMGILI